MYTVKIMENLKRHLEKYMDYNVELSELHKWNHLSIQHQIKNNDFYRDLGRLLSAVFQSALTTPMGSTLLTATSTS